MQDATQDALTRVKDGIKRGDLITTIEACEELLAETPDSLAAHYFLGLTSMMAGDAPRAMNLFERAHQSHPECREVVLMLAALNGTFGRLADTAFYAKVALTMAPDADLADWVPVEFRDPTTALMRVSVPRYVVDGSIQYQLGQYADAVRNASMALEVDKHDHAAFDLMGRALLKQGFAERAVAALHAAVHLAPDNTEYRADLGEALIAKGAYGEGRALLASASRATPDSVELASRLADAAHFDPNASRASLEAASAAWEKAFATAPRIVPAPGNNGRPAVGYLINQDAVDHWLPVIEAVLSTHNQNNIDIHVFQQYPHHEQATVRLRRHCASWRETFNIDDDTFAFMLKQLQLDVLVDLCGFTPGNRRALLARGVARTQVAWLNEGVETLGTVMDYAIGDAATESVAAGARQVVVPGGLLRHRGLSVPAATADLPARRNGFVTFGAIADLTGAVQSAPAWAEVLRQVPNSRLLLGNANGLDAWTAERFTELFAHWGLSTRLDFQKAADDAVNADAFFSEVDVVLDGALTSGDISTCQALREGVPVVTLAGATTLSRLGASILTTAGRPEWIGSDVESFAAIAADLAADLDALEALRGDLRQNYPSLVLANGTGLASALEAVYVGFTQR